MSTGAKQVEQVFGPCPVPQCAVASQVSGRDGARPQQARFQQMGLAAAGLNGCETNGAGFPHAAPLLAARENVHQGVAHVRAIEGIGGSVQLCEQQLSGIAPGRGHGGQPGFVRAECRDDVRQRVSSQEVI